MTDDPNPTWWYESGGIYGLVKFHQTGKAYERLAGRESKFTLYFWLFIGLGVLGFFLSTHKIFLILGMVLSVVLVGLVFTLIQAIKGFQDWNAIGQVARGRVA